MESSNNNEEGQPDVIACCEEKLQYVFQDKALLVEAITHASCSDTRLSSNERLEFLGDAILGFVVCEYLFQNYPDWLEGQLTKIKSVVVSRQTCGRIGLDLALEESLVVGKGIGNRGPVPISLLANAFESIVAAIYLDGGMKPVWDFLMRFVPDEVASAIGGENDANYKSELQQFAQKKFGLPPTYRLLGDKGPDHEKWFKIAAHLGNKKYSPAWGRNKKEAEQRAAANALAEIVGNDAPFPIEDSRMEDSGMEDSGMEDSRTEADD